MANQPQIATLVTDLHIPASNSLKSKRRVLKSLKDRIRSQFNVSVSEIGAYDKWQRSVFGVCVIGNERPYLDGTLQRILSLIDTVDAVEIIDHQIEFI